ncbi:hypothetical protein Amsp01_046880 [Amycolatopsis sp. NBRC 101858]|nr:hypothetical protein Amsp01_046880 [Amycolatopsis sp. NBRC 101858]
MSPEDRTVGEPSATAAEIALEEALSGEPVTEDGAPAEPLGEETAAEDSAEAEVAPADAEPAEEAGAESEVEGAAAAEPSEAAAEREVDGAAAAEPAAAAEGPAGEGAVAEETSAEAAAEPSEPEEAAAEVDGAAVAESEPQAGAAAGVPEPEEATPAAAVEAEPAEAVAEPIDLDPAEAVAEPVDLDPADPESDLVAAGDIDSLPDVTSDETLEAALEALLLVVDSPASEESLADTVGQPKARIVVALRTMAQKFTDRASGIDLRRVGEGWRFYTRDVYAPFVEKLLLDGQRSKLTRAALESLAVIAYRQPVTRARVAAVRGVNVDGVIRTLLARGLIEEMGTDPETTGTLYVTTELFLERLGLSSLNDLPAIAPLLPEVDTIDDIQ